MAATMKITCKTDWSGMHAGLTRRLAAVKGKPVDDMLKDEGRLTALEMMKSTPPQTKVQGEKAIAGDLPRIFEARNHDYLVWLKDTFGETITQRTLKNKKGETYLIDNAVINPDGDKMDSWHKSHMIKSRFRTRGYGQKKWSVDIGRHTSRDKMWVSYAAYDEYYKELISKVGWLKSGWVKAVYDLGGRGKGERVPSWVERHFDNGRPKGKVDLSGLTGNAFKEKWLAITNYTTDASKIITQSMINWALKKRVYSIKARLKQIAKTGKDFSHASK